MREKFDKLPVLGRKVVRVAERQHGVVTRQQLIAAGLSDHGIARRVKDGRLWRVHQGVYAVGRPALTFHGRLMAAVLSCGTGAAVSHYAAGVLQGLLKERGPRIDVTVPGSGGRRRRGAVIIHRGPLPAGEVITVEGIPVTSPARTVVDLADFLPRRQLERVIDEAQYLRLELGDLAPRHGRRGNGTLKRVLAEHQAGTTLTRSELEERMLDLLHSRRLPTPEINADIEGYEVDFVWHDHGLIVETDGWRAHGTRNAFERDRRRDADLVSAGWRVLRVSYQRLEREPAWVAQRLAAALAA
jgi:very-short-patch-repair endonuclease